MGTFSHARMITIADFICPTAETLTAFEAESPADLIIWMNTIQASRYPDTDAMFQPPVRCDIRVRTWAEDWPQQIAAMIVDGKKPPQWNPKAPTAQMLGRFQPWHS